MQPLFRFNAHRFCCEESSSPINTFRSLPMYFSAMGCLPISVLLIIFLCAEQFLLRSTSSSAAKRLPHLPTAATRIDPQLLS